MCEISMITLASPALLPQVSDYVFMCLLLIHKLLHYHSYAFSQYDNKCVHRSLAFFPPSVSHSAAPFHPPLVSSFRGQRRSPPPPPRTYSSLSLINYTWWHLSPQDQSVCLIQSLTSDPLQLHPPYCAPTSPPQQGGCRPVRNTAHTFPQGDEIILAWTSVRQ